MEIIGQYELPAAPEVHPFSQRGIGIGQRPQPQGVPKVFDEAGAQIEIHVVPDVDDDENDIYQDVQAATTSLREHLSWQLGLMSIPDRDRTLVRMLWARG